MPREVCFYGLIWLVLLLQSPGNAFIYKPDHSFSGSQLAFEQNKNDIPLLTDKYEQTAFSSVDHQFLKSRKQSLNFIKSYSFIHYSNKFCFRFNEQVLAYLFARAP